MRRRKTVLIGGFFVGLVACALPRLYALQSPVPVFLGVLRTDGLLVPTAVFDGKEWWNAWPFSVEGDDTIASLPLPLTIEEVPSDWLPPGVRLPRQWRLQPVTGPTVPLRVSRLARPDEFSLASFIGILTDHPRRAHIDGKSDTEIGATVSGPAELGRFHEIPEREGSRLAATIRKQFDEAENEAIAERIRLDYKDRPYKFPVDQKRRARQALKVAQC